MKEPYVLDELIAKLEDIRDGLDDTLNPARALYTLALEIKLLKDKDELY